MFTSLPPESLAPLWIMMLTWNLPCLVLSFFLSKWKSSFSQILIIHSICAILCALGNTFFINLSIPVSVAFGLIIGYGPPLIMAIPDNTKHKEETDA